MTERLDKFLSNAGLGTRSEVKKLLNQKKVCVNHEIEKNGSRKVDPEADQITVSGETIGYLKHEYYLLHKPAGYLSATKDHFAPTVMDLIDSRIKDRLFPVGRLDKDTEGLLLITDDGQLAHQLLSPKKHVPKTYYAKVDGCVPESCCEAFANGLDIGDERPTLPAKLQILAYHEQEQFSEIQITVQEGRFHQIKRMCHAVGHDVWYLKRISMGALILDEHLGKGQYRTLSEQELLLLGADSSQ